MDPDYYEFETHVFFDDAFEPHDEDEYLYRVNSFVKQLLLVMDAAARCDVYQFINNLINTLLTYLYSIMVYNGSSTVISKCM